MRKPKRKFENGTEVFSRNHGRNVKLLYGLYDENDRVWRYRLEHIPMMWIEESLSHASVSQEAPPCDVTCAVCNLPIPDCTCSPVDLMARPAAPQPPSADGSGPASDNLEQECRQKALEQFTAYLGRNEK